MKKTYPSQNMHLLRALINNKIVSVHRQIFKDDITLNDYEQSADGPVELELSDGTFIHWIDWIEKYSVCVVKGRMPRYGESYLPVNVSNNSFWNERLNKTIKQVAILKLQSSSEDFPEEFGVEIQFSNGKKALIESVSDEDCPDTIRVAKENYRKNSIAQYVC